MICTSWYEISKKWALQWFSMARPAAYCLAAKHCNTLQHAATRCNTLQRTATHGNTRQYCNTRQHTAAHCNTHCNSSCTWSCTTTCSLRSNATHTATHCNTLQHTATHCNTLQHTATHCNTLCNSSCTWSCTTTTRSPRSRCNAHCNTLQYTAKHCNTLIIQYYYTLPRKLPRKLQHTLQHTLHQLVHVIMYYYYTLSSLQMQHTLQYTATHCNTLQHTDPTATHTATASARNHVLLLHALLAQDTRLVEKIPHAVSDRSICRWHCCLWVPKEPYIPPRKSPIFPQ